MDFKLIFSNIFIFVLFYYLFKLFDKKYIYYKSYTIGYWLGFVLIFVVPAVFADAICFFSPPLWVALSVIYLATAGCASVWYGLTTYNKEKLEKEGIVPEHFLIKNPKVFKVIAFFPIVSFSIAIILIVFLK